MATERDERLAEIIEGEDQDYNAAETIPKRLRVRIARALYRAVYEQITGGGNGK